MATSYTIIANTEDHQGVSTAEAGHRIVGTIGAEDMDKLCFAVEARTVHLRSIAGNDPELRRFAEDYERLTLALRRLTLPSPADKPEA